VQLLKVLSWQSGKSTWRLFAKQAQHEHRWSELSHAAPANVLFLIRTWAKFQPVMGE